MHVNIEAINRPIENSYTIKHNVNIRSKLSLSFLMWKKMAVVPGKEEGTLDQHHTDYIKDVLYLLQRR